MAGYPDMEWLAPSEPLIPNLTQRVMVGIDTEGHGGNRSQTDELDRMIPKDCTVSELSISRSHCSRSTCTKSSVTNIFYG